MNTPTLAALIAAITITTPATAQETCGPEITTPDGVTTQACSTPLNPADIHCDQTPDVARNPDTGDRHITLTICPDPLVDQLRHQLRRERARHAQVVRRLQATNRRLRARVKATTSRPDAWTAFQLAGLAYGQDWRQLRACALSEGYRDGERYAKHNTRPNKAGSGAFGAFQFMRGTFLSTPQGKAGLDWTRVDVQAHAAAWMWSAGRRGEWTGRGC